MHLYWAPTPLEVNPKLNLAQFTINSIEFEATISKTPRGNFSTLIVSFHLSRDYGFYVIQIYVPSL